MLQGVEGIKTLVEVGGQFGMMIAGTFFMLIGVAKIREKANGGPHPTSSEAKIIEAQAKMAESDRRLGESMVQLVETQRGIANTLDGINSKLLEPSILKEFLRG